MTWIEPSINNTVDLLQWSNASAEGFLGTVIVIAIFFVFFMSFKITFPTAKAYSAASAITAIAAILLFALGIMNEITLFICIIGAVIGIIALFVSQESGTF